MPLIRRGISMFLLLLTPALACAWGKDGHRIVGELAQRQLKPAAQAEVSRLLAGEPEPSLAGIANWADELREQDPERTQPSSKWHYVNFPRNDCNYTPPRDCPDGNCAVNAINRQFLILSDKARSDTERREALKFLVHIVGDVHQPFHAGYRDDRGGNNYQIQYAGEGTDLHHIWDRSLIKSRGLTPGEYVLALEKQEPLPYDRTRMSDRPAVDWVTESCKLVQQGVLYPPKHSIGEAYIAKHRPLAEQRLRQAGARLADMINYALAR
ncbi:S1/P1 nuclease [Arenimonas sp.]|uniref:S1/P1 nuclease n=1 Tax=Arenimonas sp. TaxID=1872635 RepID=UPI0039E3FBC7